jgi:L-asparaginase
MAMKIKVFTASGTIDKMYSEEKGTLNFSFGKQAVRELGENKVRLNFEYDVERLLAKDSLEMTDEDRALIKRACEGTVADKILITHGTDTMVNTAEVLSTIPNKVIVLTGASQPYKFRESDAEFNIGVAVGALNILDHGVYIAMNGRVYEWDKVQKQDDGLFGDK